MTSAIARPGGEPRESVPRDGCVVDAAPISTELRTFIAGYRGRSSPQEWLSDETALKGRRIGVDKIEQLAATRTRYRRVELRDADVLLAAIGRVDVLHSLEVYPNPIAPAAGEECSRTNLAIDDFRTELGLRPCCGTRMSLTATSASLRARR